MESPERKEPDKTEEKNTENAATEQEKPESEPDPEPIPRREQRNPSKQASWAKRDDNPYKEGKES